MAGRVEARWPRCAVSSSACTGKTWCPEPRISWSSQAPLPYPCGMRTLLFKVAHGSQMPATHRELALDPLPAQPWLSLVLEL